MRVALANLTFPATPDDAIVRATAAIARPDGTLLAHQPYGEDGVLVADLDLAAATRLLALRTKRI